ncbi:GntR family transcriptional regulator [Streptomyces sp. KN37]|uniref:GntR family transcriptional regulator n=1 Tax=Streptomyces sp. KN37 TaxID=3090667 RepID=UPI002A754F8E|nr:GntR family transcriptional regulator [Streptomyces sp. KN37]WPO76210.1 GntR family transcriptional regulator [Streptomyces sp. KN37]
MLVEIDTSSTQPLADQVAAAVRRAMVTGALRVGERLPAARELASSLGISVHTVLRGYQTLQSEGLIELRRGRGAVVIAHAPHDRAAVVDQAHSLVTAARRIGMPDAETLRLVSTCMERQ